MTHPYGQPPSRPQQPPYPPPPGWRPPPPRRRNPAAIVLGLVLGGVALLFAGCVAVAAIGAHAGPDGGASSKVYAMNEGADDGQFTFVVTKMERTDHVGDSVTGSDAQGEFIVLTINVMNHGSKSQMLDASDQHLIADGKTYTATTDLSGGAFLNTINPGNSVTATIAFDVPAGTQPTQVVLHDSAFSNGVRVTLK